MQKHLSYKVERSLYSLLFLLELRCLSDVIWHLFSNCRARLVLSPSLQISAAVAGPLQSLWSDTYFSLQITVEWYILFIANLVLRSEVVLSKCTCFCTLLYIDTLTWAGCRLTLLRSIAMTTQRLMSAGKLQYICMDLIWCNQEYFILIINLILLWLQSCTSLWLPDVLLMRYAWMSLWPILFMTGWSN